MTTRALLLLLCVGYSSLCDAGQSHRNNQNTRTTALVESKKGLVTVLNNGGDLAEFKFVGWAKNWEWDSPKADKLSSNSVAGKNLKFFNQDVAMNVQSTRSRNEVLYNFDLSLNKDLDATIGGGIQFNLKPQAHGRTANLLPNRLGWTWEYEDGEELRVEFSQPLAEVKFERNNKHQIRAFFFKDKVNSGNLKIQMNVSLAGHAFIKNGDHAETAMQEYEASLGLIRRDSRLTPPPLDLSYLNHKPAGKLGFVSASGSKLVYENNQQARFFGVNIQAYSLFIKDKELIREHAKRLAKLGFNLARLHHHDSASWVKKTLIKNGKTTQEIDPEALDSYHWWIHCLKQEGIYVWIDLQVSRIWREGDDIPGWGSDFTLKKGMASGKGLIYLNDRMIELTKAFNEKLLLTTNPYTELNLVEDPAIMGVMITNENDLTSHFGHILSNEKKYPYHNKLFNKAAYEFGNKLPFWERRGLTKTWELGNTKVLLNDIEANFNAEMTTHLRETGLKVPISTTSMWGRKSSLFSLPALTYGDIIDAHTYTSKNPLLSNPMTEPNFVQSIAYAQVPDKPFSVSEYNVENKYAADYSHIILPYFSALAAFQDWDAIMLYGYSQDAFKGKALSSWSSYSNANFLDLAATSALIYRTKHVAVANESVVITGLENKLFTENISPYNNLSYRTLIEQKRVTTAMPGNELLQWLKPSSIDKKMTKIRDLDHNFLNENAKVIRSDTGQLTRDWQQGLFTINSDKTQGSVGGPAGELITLKNVAYSVNQKKSSTIFSSLDDLALNRSKQILLTTTSSLATRKSRDGFITASKNITGEFRLSSILPQLTISPLNGESSLPISIKTMLENGRYIHSFTLGADSDASLYKLSLQDKKD